MGTNVHDLPSPSVRCAQTVTLDDGAEVTVSMRRNAVSDWPASLAINSALMTVQIGVCLTRDQLVELHAACGEVLAETEPTA